MKRQRPPTRRGLLPEATHLVLPKGIVATGFPSIKAVCGKIGIEFDPWQQDLNQCVLSKDTSALYAADTVAMSVPRQVGKTYDVGGLSFGDSIAHPGTTTVWTAHRFKVARESFNEMRAWAKSPLLRQHIDYDEITTAAGNECIPFRNGSRIVFAARERGAIRGFTKVRRLVLDEAQILTEQALADLVPTMNQADNPQVILMGTPPKPTDPSEVFTRIRAEALDGTSDGVLYVELSAPPGSDPDDREAWRVANPSFPSRTPAKAILRLRKLLSVEDFMREALGMWDDLRAGSPIDLLEWANRRDAKSKLLDPVALGLSVAPWQTKAAVAVGGRRPDTLGHGELIEHRDGTGWVVPRLVEFATKHGPCVLTLNPRTESGALIKALNEAGFVTDPEHGQWQLQLLGASEYAQACGGLVADIRNNAWRHLNQAPLNTAVEGARTRKLADAWAWSWKDSTADISPLEAVTCARQGFATYGLEQPQAFFGSWR